MSSADDLDPEFARQRKLFLILAPLSILASAAIILLRSIS
jgi:hypothetical protein